MPKIPAYNPIAKVLDEGLITDQNRPYIGMSGLGGKCSRKIWYDFRWAYERKITKRLARIFERGDLEEERVVSDLRRSGMSVTREQEEIVDETGHIRGHIDGIVSNVPGAEKTVHLLEVKTMNGSRFKQYVKEGIQKHSPEYYAQINQYMGYLNLTRCLFIVTNKDNEERDYKRIHFDKVNFQEHKSRGLEVLMAEYPPYKIGEKTWHVCKMCDAKEVCQYNKELLANCRTCANCSIENQGKFRCLLAGGFLSTDDQRLGCHLYEKSEVFDV